MPDAIDRISSVLAGNGVSKIYLPQGGIMSTPAASAFIRSPENDCEGGILLTASHNPGGPDGDFGIKFNGKRGEPADEMFTDEVFRLSSEIDAIKTTTNALSKSNNFKNDNANLETYQPMVDDNLAIDDILFSTPKSSFRVGVTDSFVHIVDPFADYVDLLKREFSFDKLRALMAHPEFYLLFDGMHGAGGPFARRIFQQELGLESGRNGELLRCDPRDDFGGCHPDPNLKYAAGLVSRCNAIPTANANANANANAKTPTLGAANDGDGDRNMIVGHGIFVTPSDSLAIICNNQGSIPGFSRAGGLKGCARSMPSSSALDVVAAAHGIPCFVTPTGWKFFGNLMDSKDHFGKTDYTPFLCGEESFGTGSSHVREKDGVWAVLAWMSILADKNSNTAPTEPLVTVKHIVHDHWRQFGRHFYCRYDYEGVDSEAANAVMEEVRSLSKSVEFIYEDPVDGSVSANQGLILQFDDTTRAVFRLSGTGSEGATIRIYLEQYVREVSEDDLEVSGGGGVRV